jgi:hypothetical protein
MPSELQTSKTFFLVSAIINILFVLGWGGWTVIGGIATCGIGCLAGFLPILNLVCCVMDFISYSKVNNLNQTGTFSTMQYTAILEIVTLVTGNFVSMTFGILILTYLNKPEVKNFLQEKQIY